jgi:hypothetical protein
VALVATGLAALLAVVDRMVAMSFGRKIAKDAILASAANAGTLGWCLWSAGTIAIW